MNMTISSGAQILLKGRPVRQDEARDFLYPFRKVSMSTDRKVRSSCLAIRPIIPALSRDR
jgi:hypothetical protein